jgi:imidazole glycerol-phosphate synthase subunit HisH
MIIVIDYGMGNLRSVEKKLNRVAKNVRISSDMSVIAKASKLVLPGVGHFTNGVKKLHDSGIWNLLNEKVLIKNTPILGICLGMQLMASTSEEGNAIGLGWFDAKVVKFNIEDKLKYKVPNIGWNSIELNKDSELFLNLSENAMYYFVHSYHIKCNNQEDILTTTKYENPFTSSINKGNIYGTQFHPEKSHNWGERLLQNFVNL